MARSETVRALRWVVAALIALNLLLVAAWLVTRPDAPATSVRQAPAEGHAQPLPASDSAAAAALARLQRELESERRLRDQLERRVDRLDEKLAALLPGATEPAAVEAAVESDPKDVATTASFLDASLLELGVASYEVDRLRAAWEQWELDKLYAHDAARREGYAMRPRHRLRLNQIRDELQRELGEDDFDRLLYGSGQTNRVIVTNVLDGSAASDAGFESGDIVLAYDDQRIFRAGDLRTLTGQGEGGAMVAVDLQRAGARVRAYLPRGPMGVMLTEERRKPPS